MSQRLRPLLFFFTVWGMSEMLRFVSAGWRGVLETVLVNLLVVLEEKSEDHQSHWDLSSGD